MKMELGMITGAPGQWHSRVRICVDTVVAFVRLLARLNVWITVSEDTQLFGVHALDPKG